MVFPLSFIAVAPTTSAATTTTGTFRAIIGFRCRLSIIPTAIRRIVCIAVPSVVRFWVVPTVVGCFRSEIRSAIVAISSATSASVSTATAATTLATSAAASIRTAIDFAIAWIDISRIYFFRLKLAVKTVIRIGIAMRIIALISSTAARSFLVWAVQLERIVAARTS